MHLSLALRRSTASGSSRAAFTLAELIVTVTLLGIVIGAIITVLARQQRFYRSAHDLIQIRGQLRQAASVLPYDLRWVSTSDTTVNAASTKSNADVYSRDDHTFEFRQLVGSSVVCAIKKGPADTVVLMPKILPSAMSIPITSWVTQPVAGDSVLILDEGVMLSQADDHWRAHAITSLVPQTGSRGCPTSSVGNLLAPADSMQSSYRIVVSPALSTTIASNAPVRIFRRVKYSLYQASDNNWYLGYSDCLSSYTTASKCSTTTPIAGPFVAYGGGQSGLTFTYYDSTGAALITTAPSSSIARVNVTLRAVTRNVVDLTGQTKSATTAQDSVVMTIGVRNRS